MHRNDKISVKKKKNTDTAIQKLWESRKITCLDLQFSCMTDLTSKPENMSWLYLVCQFSEVLLRIADDIPHFEDGAVSVVDHVKVTFFDVIVSDGWKEVAPAHTQVSLINILDHISSVIVIIIIHKLYKHCHTWCSWRLGIGCYS